MKKYKCDKCGDPMDDAGYSGYCSDCYGKIWDAGFESTSEHAYEIGFNDLVKDLKDPSSKKAEKAIKELEGEWGPLAWFCKKCKAERITKEKSSDLTYGETIELLRKPCPGCGIVGHFKPEPPDKYFH